MADPLQRAGPEAPFCRAALLHRGVFEPLDAGPGRRRLHFECAL